VLRIAKRKNEGVSPDALLHEGNEKAPPGRTERGRGASRRNFEGCLQAEDQ